MHALSLPVMDKSRSSARRRPNAASALRNDNSQSDGRRNGVGSVSRIRNAKQISSDGREKGKIRRPRIKRICERLGHLRVSDVTLFLAVAVKLSSVIYNSYHRHVPSSSDARPKNDMQRTQPATLEEEIAQSPITGDDAHDKWSFPKWVQRWGSEHKKIPFHSPLLYRREDDDYSFGYNTYLDDDDDGSAENIKRENAGKFRGMFHAKMAEKKHLSSFKEQMNEKGYAVVDDVLYNADYYRESTQRALSNSKMYALVDYYTLFDYYAMLGYDNTDNKTSSFVKPAFEFGDDGKSGHSYIDDTYYDPYYAFDDDIIRGTVGLGIEEEDLDEQNVCSRPEFARLYHPTCNEIHASVGGGHQWLIGEEVYSRRWTTKKNNKRRPSSMKTKLSKYLGSGYYRDAFLFSQLDGVSVFKTMKTLYPSDDGISEDDEVQADKMGFDPGDKMTVLKYKEYMRMDAMVIELLSSSSRAIDMYAHCSLSSIIEFAPTNMEDYIFPTKGFQPKKFVRRGDKDYVDSAIDDEPQPVNDHISMEEKLEIALEMAKCIAAMHGFEDGVIVNVDVQLGQFFRGRDGMIKIVDFNRAEPMLYDRETEQYCRWYK